jgi:hypothetical protein
MIGSQMTVRSSLRAGRPLRPGIFLVLISVCIKYLSESFPIQNDLKQGGALLSLLFKFASEYAIRKVQKNRMELIFKWDTSAAGLC